MDALIEPTFSTYAALSLDVYRDSTRPPLPENWSVFCDCPVEYQLDGYFGACYLYLEKTVEKIKTVYVILAHRGTDNVKGEIEDFYMWALKKTPHQFQKAAVPFIQYVLNLLKQQYSDCLIKLGFTGHSLGATLAELSMAYFGPALSVKSEINLSTTQVFTFESPGSKPLIQSLIKSDYLPQNALSFTQQCLTVANSDVDAINTCMEQTATQIYSCETGYSMIANSKGEYPLKPDDIYFFDEFTVKDQHPMSKMLSFWNDWSQGKTKPVSLNQAQWPIGIEKAFHSYLSYTGINEFHNKYWDQYIHLYWVAHPILQSEGYQNEAEFKKYFINHVLPDHLARAKFEIQGTVARINNRLKNNREDGEHSAVNQQVVEGAPS